MKPNNIPWTQFMDMHSGGGLKESVQYIYINAPKAEARVIFYNRFGHSADRVSCTCCGSDYSVTESEDLAQATAYERNCDYDNESRKYLEQRHDRKYGGPFIPLEDYLKSGATLFIPDEEIKPEEREGEVPESGYVWVD